MLASAMQSLAAKLFCKPTPRERRPQYAKPRLEALEGRLCLSDTTYVFMPSKLGDGQSWANGYNWGNAGTGTYGTVPAKFDTVIIPGNNVVKVNDNYEALANNISLSSGSTLIIPASSSLYINNNGEFSGRVIDQGEIYAASQTVVFIGGFIIGPSPGGGVPNLAGPGEFDLDPGPGDASDLFADGASIGQQGSTNNPIVKFGVADEDEAGNINVIGLLTESSIGNVTAI